MPNLSISAAQLGTVEWNTSTEKKNTNSMVSVGDFNGDQIHDIAIVVMDANGVTSDIQIFLGGKGGSFSNGTSLLGLLAPVYQAANPIWTEDINKDGISDIVIGTSNGDGDTTNGIFGAKQQIYLSSKIGEYKLITSNEEIYAHHAAVADANGDGYLDVFFTATSIGPSLLALFDPSTQSFKITSDGLPSKLVNVTTSGSWEEISKTILPNGDHKIIYSAYHHHNSEFLDIDRDGDRDLIMFFVAQNALVFPNNGGPNPSFSNTERLSIDTKLSFLHSFDTEMTVIWSPITKTNTLEVHKSGFNPYETVIFDVNKDGWSDILVSGTYEDERYVHDETGKVTFQLGSDRFNDGTLFEVFISNGKTLINETESRITQFGSWENKGYHGGFWQNLKLVDFNGDGFLDFTSNTGSPSAPNVPSWSGDQTTTAFMLNDGNGNFSRIEIPGLELGAFTPIPIMGKVGFVHVRLAGHRFSDPQGSTQASFFTTNVPWTLGDTGNNFLYGTPAWDLIDGSAGRDTFYANGRKSDFDLTKSESGQKFIAHESGLGGNDTLISIERIRFDDGVLLFDVDSANGPAAYRLYGGAFDRTPDEGGFRYWAETLDAGVSLQRVAASFIASNEFSAKYGNNLSNSAFIDALYMNVLNRPGETAGVAYWNEVLDKKLADRADVLVSFTQLPEYVGLSMKDIENGYWVV